MAAEPSFEAEAILSAHRNGRPVLLVYPGAQPHTLACAVYPVDAFRAAPHHPTPYVFASEENLGRFLAELGRSLTYLGCEVVGRTTLHA